MATMFPNPTQGPAGPWPQAGVDARQGMIDFYGKLLEAAKKVDPNATLTNDRGSAYLNINGKANYITSTHKADYDNYGITPDQIVSGYFLGTGLNLTTEQRAKVQASQVSALQSVAGQDMDPNSENQVQKAINQLQAFWKTPAGQGIDPNAPSPPPAYVAPPPNDPNMIMSPFGPLGPKPNVAPPPGGGPVLIPGDPPRVPPPGGGDGGPPPDVSLRRLLDTVWGTAPPPETLTPPAGGGGGVGGPGGDFEPPWKPPSTGGPLLDMSLNRRQFLGNNALAPQVKQPVQPVNQNYQRNLDRFRSNRWGRGGS